MPRPRLACRRRNQNRRHAWASPVGARHTATRRWTHRVGGRQHAGTELRTVGPWDTGNGDSRRGDAGHRDGRRVAMRGAGPVGAWRCGAQDRSAAGPRRTTAPDARHRKPHVPATRQRRFQAAVIRTAANAAASPRSQSQDRTGKAADVARGPLQRAPTAFHARRNPSPHKPCRFRSADPAPPNRCAEASPPAPDLSPPMPSRNHTVIGGIPRRCCVRGHLAAMVAPDLVKVCV